MFFYIDIVLFFYLDCSNLWRSRCGTVNSRSVYFIKMYSKFFNNYVYIVMYVCFYIYKREDYTFKIGDS